MHKYRKGIFYSLVLLIFTGLMFLTAIKGKMLETDVFPIVSSNSVFNDFLETLKINLHHPLAVLLIQIVTIVLVARIFGWVFQKIGQPSVIGEIIAGIALGPSFFGAYFPEFSTALFPVASLGNLNLLAQIGLILFMFVVGMELDLKVIKNKASDAVVISHASIVIPFALGMFLSYFIYKEFAPNGTPFLSFSLFLGIAMSITAFPVLARIVQERGIHKTRLGTVVLTAAAADDITAWCMLAIVIAIVKAGSFMSALYVIALAILYVIVMLKMVRPFLHRIGQLNKNKENLDKATVALFFLTLVLSSYATEVIGIHALFGAFMTGAIMPDSARFRHVFVEKVEDVAVVLFLPLFFVFTGLRTEIGLLNDLYLWKVTGLIILVAVIGKFVGSALASKFVGQSWKNSLTIGALMNTRGLMELVVLNIGFELGVLTPEVFAMMVIMALFTTFMTGPILDLINYFFKSRVERDEEIINETKFKILFYFSNSDSGKQLLKLASVFIKNQKDSSEITALQLTKTEDLDPLDSHNSDDIFHPVIEESKKLNQKILTMQKVSTDISSEVLEVAHKGNYDLILMDMKASIYDGTLLGKLLGFTTRIVNPEVIVDKFTGKEALFDNSPFDDTTRAIVAKSKIPVGIFIEKDLQQIDRIVVPFITLKDKELIPFALKFIQNNNAQITFIDEGNILQTNPFLREEVRLIEHSKPNNIKIVYDKHISKNLLEAQDLLLISHHSWIRKMELKKTWLNNRSSVLIIKT